MTVATAVMVMMTLIVVLLVKTPVTITVNVSSTVTVMIVLPAGMTLMAYTRGVFANLGSFPLLTVPFFILTNGLVGGNNVTVEVVELTRTLYKELPNTLTRDGILTGVFFKTVDKDKGTTTTTVNKAVKPVRTREKCSGRFSTTIGVTSTPAKVLVPPDGTLVIFSAMKKSVSMTTLFVKKCVPKVL